VKVCSEQYCQFNAGNLISLMAGFKDAHISVCTDPTTATSLLGDHQPGTSQCTYPYVALVCRSFVQVGLA
jgi:hypothetical protein